MSCLVDTVNWLRKDARYAEGAAEVLEHVADLEENDRARRGLERRISPARLENVGEESPVEC